MAVVGIGLYTRFCVHLTYCAKEVRDWTKLASRGALRLVNLPGLSDGLICFGTYP